MDARSPGAPRRARAANRQRAAKRSDREPSGSYRSTSIAPANVTRADVTFPLAALSGGMATMRSWIDHSGEVVWEPAPSLVAQLVEAGQPFWLDIENPTDEIVDQLATRLGLHPLAVEDSKQFGQRAKLQVYGNGAMLVGFGLDEQLREPVEVHCYYTTGFLITLRRAPSPALDALRQAGSVQPQLGSDPIRALHPLISSLYTQFSALALELDERLDALEQRVLHQADDQELAEITAIRRRAAVTRRILTPGRDLAARTPLIQSLPGATSETQLYAEDINDELQQVVADLTAIEERCAALLVLARLARKQAPGGREPPARRCGHHFPAHLLPGRLLGTELRRAHRQHRKGMASVPDPRRGTERGLRRGDRLHAQPPQLEMMRISDELTDSRWGASRPGRLDPDIFSDLHSAFPAWPAGVAAGAGHPAGRAAWPAPTAAGGVVVLGSGTHRAGHGTSSHRPRVP